MDHRLSSQAHPPRLHTAAVAGGDVDRLRAPGAPHSNGRHSPDPPDGGDRVVAADQTVALGDSAVSSAQPDGGARGSTFDTPARTGRRPSAGRTPNARRAAWGCRFDPRGRGLARITHEGPVDGTAFHGRPPLCPDPDACLTARWRFAAAGRSHPGGGPGHPCGPGGLAARHLDTVHSGRSRGRSPADRSVPRRGASPRTLGSRGIHRTPSLGPVCSTVAC
jgi:hypothetical protein